VCKPQLLFHLMPVGHILFLSEKRMQKTLFNAVTVFLEIAMFSNSTDPFFPLDQRFKGVLKTLISAKYCVGWLCMT